MTLLTRRALLQTAAGGLAGLLLLPTAMAQSPSPTWEQGARPYRIYMALWRGWEDAAQGFRDYFEERGLPVVFVVRDAAQNTARIPEMVREARAMKADLVLVWGTSMALGMIGPYDAVDPARHITDIPVVFMIVSQPVDVKIVPDLVSSRRNVTGVTYLIPEETQLNFARQYVPFKRLGIVFNPAEQNARITVAELQRLSGPMGFELIEQAVPLDAQGRPVAESLPEIVAQIAARKPDLIYQGPDSFLNQQRKAFTEAAVAHGLPVFAAGEGPVRSGSALMGVVNRYYTVGQLAALKAEQVLFAKVPPAQIPIEMPPRFSVIVNIRVAKALKLYPPMLLLKFAEIVE